MINMLENIVQNVEYAVPSFELVNNSDRIVNELSSVSNDKMDGGCEKWRGIFTRIDPYFRNDIVVEGTNHASAQKHLKELKIR
ncbi:putative neuropeptide Y receptor [Dirofilaria immitis]